MEQVQYFCTNCKNRFDSEVKEIIECPRCFWTSSVKRADEKGDVRERVFQSSSTDTAKAKTPVSLGPLFKVLLWVILLLGVIGLLVFFAPRLLSQFQSSVSDVKEKVTLNFSEETSSDQIEPTEEVAPADLLSSVDKNILERRIQISENRKPSPEELKILQNRVSFQTGFIERLPSQPWSLETFQEMLKSQEELYKIPFPKSYKKKLYAVIEEKYVPAVESFRAGDLLGARNGWMEALILPIYGKDIQRHRSVALTILRPYVNDTLSKIGAINTMLLEKNIRDRERSVSLFYSQLFGVLESESWQEAEGLILEIQKIVDQLDKPQTIADRPPTYPLTISQVDQDIRAPLLELLSAPTPPVADTASLKFDLTQKRQVVQSFLSSSLVGQRQLYEEAIDHIEKENWQQALGVLKQIQYPVAMAQDANAKAEVITKILS